MIILKIILWIVLIVIGLLVLLFLYAMFDMYRPRTKREDIYHKSSFSFEMCEIIGKCNRGEITKEEEYRALKEAYAANKAIIDEYSRIDDNAMTFGHKWGIDYSRSYISGENQVPIPLIAYWSDEFILFGKQKINEGVKANFFSRYRNPLKAHRL
jgi:hypothetical protein